MCKFRDLRADEIECRVQSAKQNGLVLLLYKDARVDMNILDETVGAACWQREHYECKGNLFCRVGIKEFDPKSMTWEWVFKSDCGTESNTEAQKGEASDSFKRACFNWGIGRELYTAPFTWIPADKCNIKETKDGRGQARYACYDNFVVESITIENKQITGLRIYNQTKKCLAFSLGENGDKNGDKKVPTNTVPQTEGLTYEKALEVKLSFGDYEGQTLKEIYKTDRDYIKWLYENDKVSDYIKTAITIINAEIRKANAK